ncbi:MAG: NAD(P)-dependent oxidoreductase [Rhodospirillales bacterium]|jgi:3-hydroxyisobutyrate dehydrogenase
MSTEMIVGFVGIGTMGDPMVRHVAAAGYAVVVYDTSPQAIARIAKVSGIEKAGSLAELATRCNTIITMLPNGKTVHEVILGKPDTKNDCLSAGLRAGSMIIDMSSSDPIGTRQLGEELESFGLRLLDAPVSGGRKGAEQATLAIMVGGETAPVEEFRTLLGTMGKIVHHAGPLGSGHAVKALNNYVSAAGFTAALEAMLVGHRFGIDPGTIIDIINTSSGRNNSTETKIHQQVLPRSFKQGFALGLMAKDLRTALDLAQGIGLDLPLAKHCVGIWNKAEATIGGDTDHTELLRYLEQATGEYLDG